MKTRLRRADLSFICYLY